MKAVLLASWLASLVLAEVMTAERLWSVPGVELGVEVGVEMKQLLKRNAEQPERPCDLAKRAKSSSYTQIRSCSRRDPQSYRAQTQMKAHQPSRMLRLSCPSQASVPSVSLFG